jgi:WD40 repeat protein
MTAVTPDRSRGDGNPYVGPRAFQYGERIYGRNREVLDLLDLLIAERITLLHSPSGAGKTSLVQAGLIPRLEREGFHVLPVTRVGLEPPPGLRSPLAPNRYLFSMLLSLEQRLPADRQLRLGELVELDLSGYLRRRAGDDDRADGEVLILDQFEELLVLDPTDQAAKAAFLTQLGEVLRDRRRWALFAMREDWIGGLDPYLRWLPTRLSTTLRLDFLGEAAARSAIQSPALDAGVTFSDAAASKLVDDLRRVRVQRPDGATEEPGPYVEPVQLQVVCRRLWERLPADATEIQQSHVEAVGDVDSALADYYVERVQAIAEETGVGEGVIREWFDRQLITEQGFRGQVLRGPAGDGDGGDGDEVLRLLEDAHLVRGEQRRGATWFELAHDRLIGPIRASNAAWRERNVSALQRQAALWQQEGRPDGLLLRGDALAEAERWAADNPHQLSATDSDFLAACRAMALREHAELARSARRLRWLVAALVLFLVVSLVSTAFALQQRSEANRQASLNHSRQLAALAAAVQQSEPVRALQLGIEASGVADTPEASSALLAALQHNPGQVAPPLEGDAGVATVAFSPDGRTLATAGDDNKVTLWDRQRREPLEPQLTGHEGEVISLAFSPDGRTIVTGSGDSTVRLWDVQGRRPLGPPLTGHAQRVQAVAFSPNGRTVASGAQDATVRLWDVEGRRQLGPPLQGHTDVVRSVAFSPDGRTLASGSRDQTVRLWDVRRRQPLEPPLTDHTDRVQAVAFSPDGRTLVSGGDDLTVRLWDVQGRRPLGPPLTGHDEAVTSLAFSPDGRTIASGSDDRSVILWDARRRQRLGQPFTGHYDAVIGVAFSPDSRTIASASDDRRVILWDAQQLNRLGQPLAGHEEPVMGVAFSPDGRTLASGGEDGTVRLWDAQQRRPLGQPLAGHEEPVTSVAFSPDGRVLASAGEDGTVRLWDVEGRQPLGEPLTGHEEPVMGVAFSPDGRTLASGGEDGTVRLWDAQQRRPLGEPLTGHEEEVAVTSVAFSPDGRTLASGGDDGTVILWDAQQRKPRGLPLSGHSKAVTSLAFSPEGRTLASGAKDWFVVLWDAQRGERLGEPFRGHVKAVTGVAFSPDGSTLASAGADELVVLWDVRQRRRLYDFIEHNDPVNGVAFARDGVTLASGGADRTVILWDLRLPTWQRLACDVTERRLGPEKWDQFIQSSAASRSVCQR